MVTVAVSVVDDVTWIAETVTPVLLLAEVLRQLGVGGEPAAGVVGIHVRRPR